MIKCKPAKSHESIACQKTHITAVESRSYIYTVRILITGVIAADTVVVNMTAIKRRAQVAFLTWTTGVTTLNKQIHPVSFTRTSTVHEIYPNFLLYLFCAIEC